MKIYAVIPAFNEVNTLPGVVADTRQQVDHVIVVDDGSRDGTFDCLNPLPENVTVLHHETNLGKGASLRHGFQSALTAGATHVVTLDADGQHDPGDIPRLLEPLGDQQETLIIGERRVKRHAAPRLRRFANAFADFWISLAAGERIYDSQSGFRIYPARLLDAVCRTHQANSGFAFETELLITAVYQGCRLCYVPIESLYLSGARASHYRAFHDTMKIVWVVAGMLLNPRLFIPRLRHLLRNPSSCRRLSETRH